MCARGRAGCTAGVELLSEGLQRPVLLDSRSSRSSISLLQGLGAGPEAPEAAFLYYRGLGAGPEAPEAAFLYYRPLVAAPEGPTQIFSRIVYCRSTEFSS